MKEYSIFYLAKNLAFVLRQNINFQLRNIDGEISYQIIEKSLNFLIDGQQDLDLILSFAADMWTKKDLGEMMRRYFSNFEKSSAFDYQIIPQMSDFILNQVDSTTVYKCKLIKSTET